jgi:hypothetical protein
VHDQTGIRHDQEGDKRKADDPAANEPDYRAVLEEPSHPPG